MKMKGRLPEGNYADCANGYRMLRYERYFIALIRDFVAVIVFKKGFVVGIFRISVDIAQIAGPAVCENHIHSTACRFDFTFKKLRRVFQQAFVGQIKDQAIAQAL